MKTTFLRTLGRGSIPTRSVLIDAIKCQTGVSLVHESKRFYNLIDRWTRSEGKRATVVRLKQIYHQALNSIFNQPLPNYPIATTRGFPRAVIFLKKYTRTPQGIQAVLSLLSVYKTIVAPGKPDFTTITRSGPEVSEELIASITRNIPKNWEFEVDELDSPKLELRYRAGPNGNSTIKSIHDIKALQDSPRLMDALVDLISYSEDDSFESALEDAKDLALNIKESRVIHSKLSIKREGGGKDRVFAMVDYWTQCALKPLHNRLFKILRTIPQDCTFDQDKGREVLKQWSLDKDCYSLDLSSATDRFPIDLQAKVLEAMCSDDTFVENWRTLMTDRDFRYSGKEYRWSVGQPLGAYSSWSMFTISHHLVVMESFRRAGQSPKYYLLGDDIVIKGRLAADHYTKIMNELGVEIQRTKTLSRDAIEFAKRVFTAGLEVSPLPCKALASLERDPLLITEVCQTLEKRSSNVSAFRALRSSAVRRFALSKGLNDKQLIVLASNPINGWSRGSDVSEINSGHFAPWPALPAGWLDWLNLYVKYTYFTVQYNRVMSTLKTKVDKDLDKTMELLGTSRGMLELHPLHIASEVASAKSSRMHKALGAFWTKVQTEPLAALPKVETLNLEDLSRSHKKRVKHQSNVILQLNKLVVKACSLPNKQEHVNIASLIKAVTKDTPN